MIRSLVATAAEWRARYQPEGFPTFGRHRPDELRGESCAHCTGFWPCGPAREAAAQAARLEGRDP
jgi:hypothetical protein